MGNDKRQLTLPNPLSPLSIQRLREVVNYIRERGRAERFDMAHWVNLLDGSRGCKTTCCFAGFAAEKERMLPEPGTEMFRRDRVRDDSNDIQGWAEEYFGMPRMQAWKLFFI